MRKAGLYCLGGPLPCCWAPASATPRSASRWWSATAPTSTPTGWTIHSPMRAACATSSPSSVSTSCSARTSASRRSSARSATSPTRHRTRTSRWCISPATGRRSATRPMWCRSTRRCSSLAAVPYELVPVETLIGELRRAKGLRIAILDACRDNASERELKRTATRGGQATRGLARVKNAGGADSRLRHPVHGDGGRRPGQRRQPASPARCSSTSTPPVSTSRSCSSGSAGT